ncbi:MAG TPA: hypothetical protein VF941_05215 [Clostridia bacterium]
MLNIFKKILLIFWIIIFLYEILAIFLRKLLNIYLQTNHITNLTFENSALSVIFYFIIIISSIIIIFIQKNSNLKFKRFITVLCILLSLSNIGLIYDKYSEYKKSLFTVEKWLLKDERAYMVNNMIQVIDLKKLNKEAILLVLGTPDKQPTDMAHYYMKNRDMKVDLRNKNQVIYLLRPDPGISDAGVGLQILFDKYENVESFDYIAFDT